MFNLTKSINKTNNNIKNWVKNNHTEAFVLAIILVIGSILRLYKIDEYMTFLGDEGRDAIVVRRLIAEFDPILIGPGTSIGNMYLGPLYYYLMAPFLLVFNFSPAGPAMGVALLGIITIWFIWYVARLWFGKTAALITATLYTLSPAVIIYARSSWNPNIMPFFALLTIYSTWLFWIKQKYRWIVIAGISIAFALQSHYLGLLLVPIVGLFWMISLIRSRNTKYEIRNTKNFLRYSVFSLLSFLFLMSPLVIFDARHGWRNFGAIEKFFTERQTTVSAKPWNAFTNLDHVTERISQALINQSDTTSPKLLIIIFVLVLGWLIIRLFTSRSSGKSRLDIKGFWNRLNSSDYSPYVLLLSWIGITVVGLGVYKQEIYAHYFGIVYTAVFLLIGAFSAILLSFKSKLSIIVVFVLIIYFAILEIQVSPLRYPPNNQLGRTSEIADKIIEISEGNLFNFAVIAERNYEGAYQYFLERDNANFVIIDPQRTDETIADQLIVVCELPKDKCDPTHNGKAEVANFGWSGVDEVHDVAGVTVYKLIHTK